MVEERKAEKTVLPVATYNKLYYLGGLVMTLLVTVVSWLGKPQLDLVNISLIYLLPVLLTALWWGRWPSYVTAVLCVMLFDFLFVPPIFTFSVYDIRHIWSFIIFLIVSFLLGGRTELLRQQATIAQQREKSVRALYNFSREIAGVIDLARICQEMARQAGETIGRATLVLCPDAGGKLCITGSHDNELSLSKAEYAAADWSFKNGRVAGCSTKIMSDAENLYVPLTDGSARSGVFGIKIAGQMVSPEERRLIDAWAGLAAMAIERVKLVQQAQKTAVVVESDKLRMALFNSVSHELRTPLAAITGAISTLLDSSIDYSAEARADLLESILYGSTRMERIVTNLLDTARQESGMLKLKNDWCDIEDIVGTALRRIGESRCTHAVLTQIAPGLPLFLGDCVLLEQVLVNLVDNAMKYSPSGTAITIVVEQRDKRITLAVIDQGSGIAAEDTVRIFEKFYRAPQVNKVAGTGLGLSICRGIIEAHNGRIWAENHAAGGAKITFSLPLPDEGKAISFEAGERDE